MSLGTGVFALSAASFRNQACRTRHLKRRRSVSSGGNSIEGDLPCSTFPQSETPSTTKDTTHVLLVIPPRGRESSLPASALSARDRKAHSVCHFAKPSWACRTAAGLAAGACRWRSPVVRPRGSTAQSNVRWPLPAAAWPYGAVCPVLRPTRTACQTAGRPRVTPTGVCRSTHLPATHTHGEQSRASIDHSPDFDRVGISRLRGTSI